MDSRTTSDFKLMQDSMTLFRKTADEWFPSGKIKELVSTGFDALDRMIQSKSEMKLEALKKNAMDFHAAKEKIHNAVEVDKDQQRRAYNLMELARNVILIEDPSMQMEAVRQGISDVGQGKSITHIDGGFPPRYRVFLKAYAPPQPQGR